MKRNRETQSKHFGNIKKISILSVMLAIVLVVMGTFFIKEEENTSKAEDYKLQNGTNLGEEYNLKPIENVSSVNNVRSNKKIMTVASSFYNYRYDHEIEKGWRDQGIDGELSGVQNPFSKFNSMLSKQYKTMEKTNLYGVYVGNFYNHWTGSYNAKNYWWCKKNYTAFAWAQNIANRGTYSAVCQGLVGTNSTEKDLKGYNWTASEFNPGTIMCSNGKGALPLFDKEFLAQEYDTNDALSIGVVAENVGFPFRYDHDSNKGSYYVFDSKYDVVRFAGSESEGYKGNANSYEYYYGTKNTAPGSAQLNYYYKENQVCTRQNKSSQFLPFNKPTAANNVDFGFGMRVDIPFYLTTDGLQLAADGGNPMKFNFEGDDDVWVFIDGELVLDLGGAHAKTKGSIDFSGTANTMEVCAKTVSYLKNGNTTAGTDCFENGSDNTDVKEYKETKAIKKDAVHVLTVFYMERGMIESNLYMDFNFIPHNEEISEPSKSTGDDIKTNSELTITNKIDFSNVASPFEEIVKDLAEDDGFQYKIENAGTGTGNVGDSSIKYPSGLLSVRENRGKKTFWSYGIAPDVMIYFDLKSVKKETNSALILEGNDDGRKWFWDDTNDPYVDYDGTPHKMEIYSKDNQVFCLKVPIGKKIRFHNNGITNVHPSHRLQADQEYEIKKEDDGKLFSITKINIDTGVFYISSSDESLYPTNSISDHSINLPYQAIGSAITFHPTNQTGYNVVAETSYKLTENYLPQVESYNKDENYNDNQIYIFQNNASTSGRTDSSGIFSLLSEDSATFINQFRMDSNMRIVQQDILGMVNRTRPPSKAEAESSSDENVKKLYKDANGGDAYVSQINKGSRQTADFYYTTVAATNPAISGAANQNDRTVTVSQTGEFKFANVKATETETFAYTDPITINETFTNKVKTGNLCIYKEVIGMSDTDANNNMEYTFTIKFKNVFGVDSGDDYTGYALAYEKYDKDGKKVKASDAAGEDDPTGTLDLNAPTVTLKKGERIVIKGIPAGTKYQITETNTNDVVVGDIAVSYETKVDGQSQMVLNGGDENTIIRGQTGSIEGTIPTEITNSATSEEVHEFDEVDVNVTFTNQKGMICLEALAIGEWKNFKNETYTFILEENGNKVNGNTNSYWTYDVYEYNASGSSIVVKSNQLITDGTIQLKATQWAVIQDISLTTDKTYTITETVKSYYTINNVDVNKGNVDTSAALTAETISMKLSQSSPTIDVTYVNRYDPTYITISKYVDKLYYQDTDGKEKLYNNVKDNEVTYQDLTGVKQSFVFTIEEYANEGDAKQQNNVIDTFQITIPVTTGNAIKADDLNLPTYTGKDNKKHTYKYQNSKTIKLTLGRVYRITEDVDWSWKYNLQGISATVTKYTENGSEKDNGSVTTYPNTNPTYAIFEGGAKTDDKTIPVINFYNTLATDTTKFNTEGDTDVVVNIIKPED